MSPVGSSTPLSPTGEVQLTTPFDTFHRTPSPPTEFHTTDDVAVDPAVMQEKIKELTNRISEVGWLSVYMPL